jgi:hypothetical protein
MSSAANGLSLAQKKVSPRAARLLDQQGDHPLDFVLLAFFVLVQADPCDGGGHVGLGVEEWDGSPYGLIGPVLENVFQRG